MSKYLITGVTGHVGGVVAEELDRAGAGYRVLVSSEAKAEPFRARGIEAVVGELGDEAALGSALAGVDGVYLLLPPPRALPGSAADFFAYQKDLAARIAATVKSSGVPHVVLLSSVGAHLPEGTGPIKGLHVLEQLLRDAGVKFTAVRAAYFMENLMGFAGAITGAGMLPNFLREDLALSMVATRDIGRVAAEALLHPGESSRIIELAGAADYRPADQAAILSGIMGRPIQLMTVPGPGIQQAMLGSGLPPAIAELYTEMYTALNSGHLAFENPGTVIRGQITLEQFAGAAFRG